MISGDGGGGEVERSTVTVGAWFLGVAGAGCAVFAVAGAPWWLWVIGVPLVGGALVAFAASPPLARRASVVVRVIVVVVVVGLLVGPWLAATQPVGRTADVLPGTGGERVRVVGDRWVVDGDDDVDEDVSLVTPAGRRLLGSGTTVDRTALSADGWILLSDEDGGLIAFDADGRQLFELGRDDAADPEVRVVAADAHRAVVLSCADDGLGACAVSSVDRRGRVGWTRRLGARWQSSVPERAGSGTGADVPTDDELWLVRPTQDDPGKPRRPSEAMRLDPRDGSVAERRDDAAVVRVGGAPRLEVSAPDGRCRTSAWRGDDRLWTRDLGADACPDVYAMFVLGPTAYVGGELPLDLGTGRVLDRAPPVRSGDAQPDLVEGADPVAVLGDRGWVLDAATGATRWRFAGVDDGADDDDDDHDDGTARQGEVEVVSSATTLAVAHERRSWNPFVARRGFDDTSRTSARLATRVLMAPVGGSGPSHSCVLGYGHHVEAVLGPDRLLVSHDDGLRAVRCR